MLVNVRCGREMATTFKFDIDQSVGDMAITSGGLLSCHFMYLAIQWSRKSVETMSNMLVKPNTGCAFF